MLSLIDSYNYKKIGLSILPEALHKEWLEFTKDIEESFYGSFVNRQAITLIHALLVENLSFEKVKEMLRDQDHSGTTYSLVLRTLATFSRKGLEFCRFVEPKLFTEGVIKSYKEHFQKIGV